MISFSFIIQSISYLLSYLFHFIYYHIYYHYIIFISIYLLSFYLIALSEWETEIKSTTQEPEPGQEPGDSSQDSYQDSSQDPHGIPHATVILFCHNTRLDSRKSWHKIRPGERILFGRTRRFFWRGTVSANGALPRCSEILNHSQRLMTLGFPNVLQSLRSFWGCLDRGWGGEGGGNFLEILRDSWRLFPSGRNCLTATSQGESNRTNKNCARTFDCFDWRWQREREGVAKEGEGGHAQRIKPPGRWH